jgi:hypothetical protein
MAKLTDDILRWNLEINGDSAMKALTDLEQTTYNLRRANEQLRLELLKLEAAGKKNTDEYKSLAAQIKSNNSTIDINRAKMATMRNEIGVNALSARQLKDELKRLKLQLDNTTPNTQAWKELSNQYNTVKNRLGEVSVGQNKSNALFGALKSILPGMGIGALVTGLFAAGKEFFQLATQMEQFDRKAKIVFGESLPKVTAAAAENARQLGLTRKEYIYAAANIADLMVPLGFTREKAAGLSVEITNLSGALSEWTAGKLDTNQVNEILTKSLLGETEQLKQLGIVIDQGSKEYNKRIDALVANEKVTREQARALDIYNQILNKSRDAQAAFAMEADTLMRQQRGIATWWRQIKENVVEWFNVPTTKKIEDERDQLNLLVNSITSVNNNQEMRNSLIKELQLKYPDFLKNLNTEKLTNEQLMTALRDSNIEYEKRIQLAVYEEDLTKLAEKQKQNFREQRDITKEINDDYDNYVINKKEGLTLEEKYKALQVEALDRNKVAAEDEAEYRTGWQYDYKQLNKLQSERNDLLKQSNSILTDTTNLQSTITPPPPPPNPQYSTDDIKNFNDAVRLEIINNEKQIRFLSEEEMKKLTEARKKEGEKRIEQEKKEFEVREGIINSAKSLIDQEKVAFDKRLKDAGLFGRDRTKLTADELKTLEILEKQYAENVKKIQEKEAEPILSIINAHKTLTEQEEMAYEKRLRDYKLFGKDKATMTADELKAFEILEKEHQENIAKINDKAFSDDITKQKELFDQATIVRQTQFNNEIIALGDDEDAKAVLKTKFQKEELEKQKQFLEEQLKQFQDKLATGEIEGLDIENSMLTDEQKEALKVKIDELKLKLSELGIEVAGIKPDPKKDLFGMTPDDWKDLWKNLLEIISIASEISSAWASINQIKANHDQKDLQQFEKDSNTRKKTLEKELKAKSITQEEYTEKIAAIDAAVEARKKKAAYDAAKRAKGQAYFDTFLNTAAASIKMLVDPGGLLGWILAASAAIMGGLKMAAIASEPLPEMKEGGYTDVIGESDKKKYHAKLAGKQKGLITEPSILVAEDKPEYVVPGDLLEKNKTVRRYVEEIEVMRVGKQFAGGGYITPPLRMDGGQGGDTAGYIIPSNARGDKDVERIIYLIDKQRENTGLSPEFIEKVYDNWQRNMDIITAGEKKLISTRADNIEIEKKLMVQREETSRLQAASVPQTIRLTAPQIIEPINFKGISQYQHPPVQKETTTITNNYPAPEANDYAELNDTVKRLNAFLDRLDKNGVEVPWTKIKEKFDQYDKIQKEVNT